MKIVYLLFILCSASVFGQNSNYTIFSFEYKNWTRTDTHYWIIENDSIGKYGELILNQIIIETDYSKTTLNSCCSKKEVSLIENNYAFSAFIDFTSLELIKYLKNNRIFLQEITHKYGTGLKSNLNVYATPVIGDFCNCISRIQNPQGMIVYNIPTYLPKSIFKVDESFYATGNWKRLQYYDFSEYLFENFH